MSDVTYRVADTHQPGHLVLIGEAQTTVGKVAAWAPVTAELLEDGVAVRALIDRTMRRLTHPWEFADRNPFPELDPVPWFTRRLVALRSLRRRILDARFVLRYGMPDRDEDDW